jgi:uncharacterized repeat protein (TIGR01451 family)
MSNKGTKSFVFLLCVLMVIGGLDLGTLTGAAADQSTMTSDRATGSRYIKTVNTTTFPEWRSGTAKNVTVYNQSDGELRLMGYEYYTITIPGIGGIRGLATDSKGNLYVSTAFGTGTIIKIEGRTGAIMDMGRPVPSDDGQNEIWMDKNDTLWGGGRSYDANNAQGVPARSGIIWRMNTTTMHFDVANKAELGISQIRTTISDKNGTIWSGTMPWTTGPGNVISRTDPTTGAVVRINGGNPLFAGGFGIYRMAVANNGMIYAGTTNGAPIDGGHIIKIDPTTNAFTVLNGHNPLINGDSIGAMATANNGTIYIGTIGTAGNIIMLDPKTDTFTNLGKPLAGVNNIGDMAAAPDGSVYGLMGANAGMEQHLLKIEAGTGAFIDMGVPVPGIMSTGFITVANDGTVWGSWSTNVIFKLAPAYQKFPQARLDRTSTGRMLSENFELVATNWEVASSVGPTNFKLVQDNSRPIGDRMVYEQQDMTSFAAYARAGAWGPIGTDSLSFNMNPGGVMEVKFKFNAMPGGGGAGAYDVRFFMSSASYGSNYALFFNQSTSEIRLLRDWTQVGPTYTNIALNKGFWYDVKWKVYHTVGGAAFTVWINGTKIFSDVPLSPPHHLSGSVSMGTRDYDASFDAMRLYKDTNITVNGLQVGQKVGLYYENGTLIKSATAAGAMVTLGVDNVSFPMSGYFKATATDGSTLLLTTSTLKDIYGGDVYSFVTPATTGSTWRYLPSGTFQSNPYDAGGNVTWQNISWNGLMPANTNLSLRTRTAPTSTGLAAAAWSSYYPSSNTAITSSVNRWIQFEARLTTTDITKTPELDDLSFSYSAFPGYTIAITQSSNLFYPNDVVTYKIYYNQTGNGLAKEVWITDKLPSVLTFLNSSDEGHRALNVWHLTALGPGAKGVLTITARVNKDAADQAALRNNASIKFTDEGDTLIDTWTTVDLLAIVQRPNMNLGLSGSDTASPGDVINYTVWYNTTGSGHHKDLWINLTLDKNLTVISSSAETWRTGTSWRILGNNDVGSVNVSAMVNGSVINGTKLVSKAVLNFTFPNGYMPAGKVAGPVETTVTSPSFKAWLSVDHATALPGDLIKYKVLFNNTGTASAKVTVTEILPAELDFLNSSAETNRTGMGVWTFPEILAGSHNTLEISARIKNNTQENITIKTIAAVAFSTRSGLVMPPVSTNEVSIKVGFFPLPAIGVAVRTDKLKAQWNETVNLTVYYNNTGAEYAGYVKIVLQMPKGLTYVTSSAEPNRNGMVWNFTTVPVGGQSFTVKATVFSGTANNTLMTVKASLNYSDARGRVQIGSAASASLMVTVLPVKPPVDTTRPSISDRKPGPDEKNVAATAKIEITFNEAMNKTAAEHAFVISPSVKGSFTWDGNTLVFTPNKELKKGQKYIIKIEPTDVTDLAGNQLNPISSWSFTVKGKKTSEQQPFSLLCIVGIIGLIVAIIVAAIYLMTRKKAAPPVRTQRRPAGRPQEVGIGAATTVAPRVRRQPVEEVVAEEKLPSEEPVAQPVEEEMIDLAQTKELTVPEEIVPTEVAPQEPQFEEPPPEEPALPEEKVEDPKAEEPVKEEAVPEEPVPEPIVDQKVEPGPPVQETVAKPEEKKSSDLDEILKKLRS